MIGVTLAGFLFAATTNALVFVVGVAVSLFFTRERRD